MYGSLTDTVEVFDIDTDEISYDVINKDVVTYDIKQYMLLEAWYYNKKSGDIQVEIVGIAPVREYSKDNLTELLGEEEFFKKTKYWISFNQIKDLLKSKNISGITVKGAPVNYYEFFASRMFKGDIISTDNNIEYNLLLNEGSEKDNIVESKYLEYVVRNGIPSNNHGMNIMSYSPLEISIYDYSTNASVGDYDGISDRISEVVEDYRRSFSTIQVVCSEGDKRSRSTQQITGNILKRYLSVMNMSKKERKKNQLDKIGEQSFKKRKDKYKVDLLTDISNVSEGVVIISRDDFLKTSREEFSKEFGSKYSSESLNDLYSKVKEIDTPGSFVINTLGEGKNGISFIIGEKEGLIYGGICFLELMKQYVPLELLSISHIQSDQYRTIQVYEGENSNYITKDLSPNILIDNEFDGSENIARYNFYAVSLSYMGRNSLILNIDNTVLTNAALRRQLEQLCEVLEKYGIKLYVKGDAKSTASTLKQFKDVGVSGFSFEIKDENEFSIASSLADSLSDFTFICKIPSELSFAPKSNMIFKQLKSVYYDMPDDEEYDLLNNNPKAVNSDYVDEEWVITPRGRFNKQFVFVLYETLPIKYPFWIQPDQLLKSIGSEEEIYNFSY